MKLPFSIVITLAGMGVFSSVLGDVCPNNRQEHKTGKGACGRFYNTCPDGFECMDNGLCCGQPGAAPAARPTQPSTRSRTKPKPKPTKVADYDESDWDNWERELGDHENDDNDYEHSGGNGGHSGGHSSSGGGGGAAASSGPCEDKTWKCFWRTSVGRCNSDNAKKYCAKTCGHCGGGAENNDDDDDEPSSDGGRGSTSNGRGSSTNNGGRGSNGGGGSSSNTGGGGGGGSSNEPCEDKSWKCFWRPSVGRCNSQNARTYCSKTCGHCGGGQQDNGFGGEGGFGGGGGPDGQFIKPEGRGCVRPCLSQFMGTLKSMNPGKICHSFRQVEWCVKECPTGWLAMKLLGPQLKLLRGKVAAFC